MRVYLTTLQELQIKIKRVAVVQAFWIANYFANKLPAIVWRRFEENDFIRILAVFIRLSEESLHNCG